MSRKQLETILNNQNAYWSKNILLLDNHIRSSTKYDYLSFIPSTIKANVAELGEFSTYLYINNPIEHSLLCSQANISTRLDKYYVYDDNVSLEKCVNIGEIIVIHMEK